MKLRAGRRRTRAVVAASLVVLAAAVLSACVPEPDPAPTTPTPTPSVAVESPSPSPSPTATLAPAVVPFGGECDKAAGSDEIGAVLASTDLKPYPSGLAELEPDVAASLALVGGLQCAWSGTTSDGGNAYAAIALFPLAVVPRTTLDFYADMQCDAHGVCGRAEVVEGTWILANVLREQGGDVPPGAQERERVDRRLGAVLSAVAAADASELTAAPAESSPDWWALPACADLAGGVTAAVAMTAAQSGFPGDSTPSGTVWDIATAAGVDRWCSWYALDGAGQVRIVQLFVQPGIGAPADDALADAAAVPVDVSGADGAWTVPGAIDRLRVLAVSGSNRVTVDVTGLGAAAAQSAAAAVIAQLDR